MAEDEDAQGPVEAATRAELERMGSAAVRSARGALAVDLARRQDGAHTPTAAAQVAKVLDDVLMRLVAEFPPAPEKDGVERIKDELAARRERGAS